MSFVAVLALGFFLGMRHATDADHVVAVSAIVSRERTLRAAAPSGVLWGIGHSLMMLLVGGAIVLFVIVIPPSVGLGMELSVAMMLLLLGVLNVRSVLRDGRAVAPAQGHEAGSAHVHPHAERPSSTRSLRPLVVGIVHGLAGSAAVALLVLGTIRDAVSALGHLVVFGVGPALDSSVRRRGWQAGAVPRRASRSPGGGRGRYRREIGRRSPRPSGRRGLWGLEVRPADYWCPALEVSY